MLYHKSYPLDDKCNHGVLLYENVGFFKKDSLREEKRLPLALDGG